MYTSIPVGQKTNSDAILQEQIPLFLFISVFETGSPIDLEFTKYVRLVVHQDRERPCLRGAGIWVHTTTRSCCFCVGSWLDFDPHIYKASILLTELPPTCKHIFLYFLLINSPTTYISLKYAKCVILYNIEITKCTKEYAHFLTYKHITIL